MNVVFATSDLYSTLALVTVKSLLAENTDTDEINIYYIGDRVSDEHKKDLLNLVMRYDRRIEFIQLPGDLLDMKGSNRNGQVVFTYCFFQDILPQSVDKVLLLEGDAIVTGSLKEYYDTDLTGYYIAAADDLQSRYYKKKLGMSPASPYVNCGIVLYNLKKWRDDGVSAKIRAVLESGEHMFFYDVQDVINYTLEGGIKVLPPRFNCTTAIFLFDYRNMIRYRRPSTCCSEEDFEKGKKDPVVVHFTKNQIIQPRPWIENCEHPYLEKYNAIRGNTAAADMPLWKHSPGKLNRFGHFLYSRVSKSLTASLLGIIHAWLYPVFLYRFLFKTK